MNETLTEKVDNWREMESRLRDKLNENRFINVTGHEEMSRKRKTRDHIEGDLAKVREILGTIERLVTLERRF